jgi:adenylyl cyclase-associated protein
LTNLQAYVKQHYTTGLTWNAKGGNAMSASGGVGAPAPPLPPPPPPPGALTADITVEKKAEPRNALLDSLNKGTDITKGLKKVSDDLKTHKNPALRGDGVVKSKEKSSSPVKQTTVHQVNKPSKLELDGKKWVVEYFKGNNNLSIEDSQTNQSVYMYKCEGSTLKVTGKCNNIIIDSCKKVAVVFDAVVSSCEFINCQSVQMQVISTVPTITVEKTDGCQMFLSKDALGVEIVTAKSSEMNVCIPSGDEFVEQPLPEQFKTLIQGTKLKTVASETV